MPARLGKGIEIEAARERSAKPGRRPSQTPQLCAA
jgi:hypothetical protein